MGTVLVTGGMGFIGVALTRELVARGYKVRVLDNLSPQVHGDVPVLDPGAFAGPAVVARRGDVVRREDLEAAVTDVEHVVHLAAETGTGQSMYEIARYSLVNSHATALLLDVLGSRPHRIRTLILSSSRSVYGEGQYRCDVHGVVHPAPRAVADLRGGIWDLHCPECAQSVEPIATHEAAATRPASIYAVTKLSQEELVRVGCTALGIPFVTLRFQNVYGPGQSLRNPYTGMLSIFSTRIRRGADLPIYEDGKESRDFVHVTDVARAIALCLESGRAAGRTLNVGSGMPTSILEVARMLISAFRGSSRTVVTGEYRVGDIRHCFADLTAIRQACGFEPRVALDAGLRGFAEWVATQPLPEDHLPAATQELRARGLMA